MKFFIIPSGFINKMAYDYYGSIPISDQGSDTTYECDRVSLYPNKVLSIADNHRSHRSSSGVFNTSLDYSFSTTGNNFWTLALSCKPPLEIQQAQIHN